MINLVKDTIDKLDIDNLIEWLKTYPRLTKGPVTKQLEEKWANWVGTKYSVFCNSGSSALLLMLHSLLESGRVERSSSVVVPSLAWATDMSSVMQLGLKPVLCDINLKDLSVDLKELEDIFRAESPSVLLLVSVLGLVPDMDEVVSLCDKYDVILLEDTCESMGSTFNNKKLGSFGNMSSFSTYFGHHMSTIEGGFINTDDEEMYHILLSIRSHGWDRDLPSDIASRMRSEWGKSDFEAMYTFYYSGMNLRGTDLQAYIGLGQIDKLDVSCDIRNKNYDTYHENIDDSFWKPTLYSNRFVSNFAFPVIHEKRNEIVKELHGLEVETRPLICGSMGTQPFYVKKYGRNQKKNAKIVDECGFYLPNHPKLKEKDIVDICDIINGVIGV
jgi:CDP-6-deoxy-D-xylo-4-hexulose-3-dehydrase